jgi:hypothetical protein
MLPANALTNRARMSVVAPRQARHAPAAQTGATHARNRPVDHRSRVLKPRRRRSTTRLLRFASLVVAATWLPGVVGRILHLTSLHLWGVASGYTGVSWAVPALLLGIATRRWAQDRGVRWPDLAAVAAGVATGVMLLVGAAALTGT